ncbi:hypothetical protein [Mycobacterium sp. URHB0021]
MSRATRRMTWLALAGGGAVSLIACGGSQTANQDASGTTQPTKLSGLQAYQSVQELADDLTRHGHTCTDVTPEKAAYYPVDIGKCTIDGKVILLSIYASEAQVDAQLKEFDLLQPAGVEYGELAGKNWSLNCQTRSYCEKLQGDMGGRIVASAPR